MSSMSIYGAKKGAITPNTRRTPKSAYGKSKLEAESIILSMESMSFSVVVLRPPMIYGYYSPGNYRQLSRAIKRIKVFPKYSNKKSFIHIDNLSEFIKLLIAEQSKGIYHPQNSYLVSTTDFAVEIVGI